MTISFLQKQKIKAFGKILNRYLLGPGEKKIGNSNLNEVDISSSSEFGYLFINCSNFALGFWIFYFFKEWRSRLYEWWNFFGNINGALYGNLLLLPIQKIKVIDYSYCKATAGSKLAALLAGQTPNSSPTNAENVIDPRIADIGM